MGRIFTDFPAGTSPFNATNANSRLQEIENAILASPAAAEEVIVPYTELGSAAVSWDMTSIPGTYKHLHLIVSAVCVTGNLMDGIALRFNGDTGNNYRGQLNHTNNLGNTTAYISTTFGGPLVQMSTGHGGNGRSFAELFIFDYTSTTKKKAVWCRANNYQDGFNYLGLHTGLWFWNLTPLAAITAIQVRENNAQNFAAETSYELLGLI